MSKRKISYIIGGICIAACVVVAGIWFLNRNKVKDDAVTVDIRTDTVSAGENEESSWNIRCTRYCQSGGRILLFADEIKGNVPIFL